MNAVVRSVPQRARAGRQWGVTLVELMVTIAINLVLVLAATLLFLNTRSTQRAVDERGAVFESGQLALDLLGREVGNAAFYPTASTEPSSLGASVSNVRFDFDKAAKQMGALPVAYQHGVFGCHGQRFDVSSNACVDHTSGGPEDSDALVVSYFTSDAFSLNVGQRADCTHADVAGSSLGGNATRVGTVPSRGGSETGAQAASKPAEGVAPDAPLLVVNRYELRAQTLSMEGGRTIQTYSLSCSGNGGSGYQPLINGVEQFVVRFGLKDAATGSPTQYLDANAVAALPADSEGRVGWQRVGAVRICLMVRSINATALRNAEGNATSVEDCLRQSVTPPNGAQLRRFEQVFSIKNRQGGTVALSGT